MKWTEDEVMRETVYVHMNVIRVKLCLSDNKRTIFN